MARDERRQQKKLQVKRARRKSRQKKTVLSKNPQARLVSAAKWPVQHSRISLTVFDEGLGHAHLSRRAPNGATATALFLIDMYCLGVKDALVHIGGDGKANRLIEQLDDHDTRWKKVSPESIRKLVEEAVGFALSLGLPPHPDCAQAMSLFGDLDPSRSTEEFQFGFDGKPNFVAGPYDSPARIEQVIDALTQSCGEGNFDYTLPFTEAHALRFFDE